MGPAGFDLATLGTAVKHASRTALRRPVSLSCSLKIRGHRLRGVVLPGVLSLTVPFKLFLLDPSILWSKMQAYACTV